MTAQHPPSIAAIPASLHRRVGACAIDAVVAVAIPLMVVSMVSGAAFAAGAMIGASARLTLMPLLLVVSAVAWSLVCTAMHGGGGSIGQRIAGLRIADAETGARIGFGRALARRVVFTLTAMIVIGLFSPLFDRTPRRQGWHDLAARAGVIDVRAGAAVTLAFAVSAVAPATAPAYRADVNSAPTRDTSAVEHAGRPVTAFGDPGSAGGSLDVDAPTMVVERVIAPALQLVASAGGTASATSAPENVEDLDATAAATSVPHIARSPQHVGGHVVLTVLTWDDGTRMALYERTVGGRNPVREEGALALAVRDETLSLSKTHFEIGADDGGPWLVDRFSTNGTHLVRDGERITLVPGVPAALQEGDRLEFGDRSAVVEVPA